MQFSNKHIRWFHLDGAAIWRNSDIPTRSVHHQALAYVGHFGFALVEILELAVTIVIDENPVISDN